MDIEECIGMFNKAIKNRFFMKGEKLGKTCNDIRCVYSFKELQ